MIVTMVSGKADPGPIRPKMPASVQLPCEFVPRGIHTSTLVLQCGIQNTFDWKAAPVSRRPCLHRRERTDNELNSLLQGKRASPRRFLRVVLCQTKSQPTLNSPFICQQHMSTFRRSIFILLFLSASASSPNTPPSARSAAAVSSASQLSIPTIPTAVASAPSGSTITNEALVNDMYVCLGLIACFRLSR
jgi:hypothetical protein